MGNNQEGKMTRKRLFEIAEENKETEDWIIAVSGVDKLCFGTSEYEETGFIINTLLPFLRDNEEFIDGFKDWCNNKSPHTTLEVYDDADRMTSVEIYDLTYQFRLFYEIEYCREILKQEETK